MREWLTEVEAEALRRFQAGQSIPSYKVVRGRATRKWNLDEDELKKKYGVKGYPTVVFLNYKGEQIERLASRDPSSVKDQIERIVELPLRPGARAAPT